MTVNRVPEDVQPVFDQPYGNKKGELVTPQQAIRRFCWECMGGHGTVEMDDGTTAKPYRPYADVKKCKSTNCWLWRYRTGRRQK